MSTIDAIDAKLATLKNQRDEAHKAIDNKFDLDLSALTRVREMLSGEPSQPSLFSTKLPKREWPGIRKSLRAFLDDVQDKEFTVDDYLNFASKYANATNLKRPAISGEFWRLAKSGEIVQIKSGRPNIYRKADSIKNTEVK